MSRERGAAVVLALEVVGIGLLSLLPMPLAAVEPADPRAEFERGVELTRQSRFEEAREAFESARSGYEASGDAVGGYETLLAMVGLYRDVGRLDEAAALVDRALAALPDADVDRWRAAGLHQRAQLRSRRGDPEGARADLAEAAATFARLGRTTDLAATEAVAAVVASWQGDFAEAVVLAESALPVVRASGPERFTVGALAALAYSLQELGRLEEAVAAYDELIPRAWARNDQRNLNFAFCNRADLRWKLGEPKGSEEDFGRAIEGFEVSRSRIWGGPDERREYLTRQIRAYDRLILLLAKTYRGVDAFDIAERFHARSFLELLEERDLDRAARIAPELRRRESRLVAELTAARGAPGEDETTGEAATLAAELAAVRGEISRVDPRYGELVAPEPLGAAGVRAALEPGEALVAYWVSDDLVLAWVLTPEKARFVWIPVPRDELEREVDAYLEPLRSADRARDLFLKGEEAAHLERGRKLHRWLVGSLPAAAREAATLIVVRDDFLHHLPFEALPSECATEAPAGDGMHAAYAGCRYLGLERGLLYAPSGSVFASLRRRSGGAETAAATAIAMAPFTTPESGGEVAQVRADLGALPFSGEEAERVARAVEGSEAFVGARATESRLKAAVGRHGVLHLATHGLVDDGEPMTSGVVLRPGGGDDGLLQAHEVLGLDLSSRLVTLSACRTGRGELSRAEGWVGLTRSFLYAGAHRVVASLWDVDDRSTPELMAAFYGALGEGAPTAEALRRARAELAGRTGEEGLVFRRRTVHYAHPRYWAGFNLQGLP